MILFDRLSKRASATVVLLVVVLAIYLLWSLVMADGNFAPEEFIDAKNQGALIAGQIVLSSEKTINNLEVINDLDGQGRYGEAMELVREEVAKNNELQQKAYKLSEELSKMGNSLGQIKPRQATEAAIKALNYETSLIIRLLNYSGFLNELLLSLQSKFSGQYVPAREVPELVAKINSEAAAINSLNNKYLESIREFEVWIGR